MVEIDTELHEASGWAEVIAIDPGGTTGWSVMQVHPDAISDPETSILSNIEHWAHGEVGGDEDKQARELMELIEAWPGAALVIEDFKLRKYLEDDDLLSPVRITAKIEFGLTIWDGLGGQRNSTYVHKQSSALAKTTVTDDRLKSWGFYQREGGEEHARDADRHALTFLRRVKEKPMLRRAAWPELYDLEESS